MNINMKTQNIARMWTGRVPEKHADGFHEHLLKTGVAEARVLNRYLGSTILRNNEKTDISFTLITYWRNEESLKQFSQNETAVLYPGDEKFELIPDDKTKHYVVTFDELTNDYG